MCATQGDHMLIVVDSSGAGDRFTVGVFVTTLSAALSWRRTVLLPRTTDRHFGQRMSYKDIRHNNEAHILESHQFMLMADKCPGLLISVSSPSLATLCVSSKGDISVYEGSLSASDWTPILYERLVRTGIAITVAIQMFYSHPHRWLLLHDTDELFTESRRREASTWISNLATCHRDDEHTPIGLAMKEELTDQLFAKALLGIADLAAGALGSGLSAWEAKYGRHLGWADAEQEDLKKKDAEVSTWMAIQPGDLKKFALSYDETDMIHVHRLVAIPRDASPEEAAAIRNRSETAHKPPG